jgi:hypothetical protein
VPDRIRALVFISCTVPREGQSTYDTLDPEIQAISDENPSDELTTLDPEIAKAVFYNDVDDPAVLEWGLSILLPEAPASVTDTMVLSTMPRDLRRVWIRLNDDVIVAPVKQDRFVETLGGCEVLELDSGHMAMVSRPRDLAALLNAI